MSFPNAKAEFGTPWRHRPAVRARREPGGSLARRIWEMARNFRRMAARPHAIRAARSRSDFNPGDAPAADFPSRDADSCRAVAIVGGSGRVDLLGEILLTTSKGYRSV